jgi:colanic acid biosynthesis glycosyl transferase WcaI
LFVPLRHMWPRTVLAHWCFDVYPEVIAADSGAGGPRALVPMARAMMAAAYGRCDAVVDLGPRMRERLGEYSTLAERQTLVPWALTEPAATSSNADPATRRQLFGEAALGLLYSGTLGRAHDFGAFLKLARACRIRHGDLVALCFCTRGHGLDELQRSLRPEDSNIRVLSFSTEDELQTRLLSADVHLLSLRQNWSGLVVPSKFFGALAAGRPVLYCGPIDSDIDRWIRQFGVGWNMQSSDGVDIVRLLEQLARSPGELQAAQRRARATYHAHFRKDLTLDRWDALLRTLVARRRNGALPPSASNHVKAR